MQKETNPDDLFNSVSLQKRTKAITMYSTKFRLVRQRKKNPDSDNRANNSRSTVYFMTLRREIIGRYKISILLITPIVTRTVVAKGRDGIVDDFDLWTRVDCKYDTFNYPQL